MMLFGKLPGLQGMTLASRRSGACRRKGRAAAAGVAAGIELRDDLRRRVVVVKPLEITTRPLISVPALLASTPGVAVAVEVVLLGDDPVSSRRYCATIGAGMPCSA